ncbi:copper chaperone PCu(A)C [Caenimonas sp. DR4.4]|uniref:Copper chaperone PCu(A)C n=2 Tax=Caenimonas aquaedulcis TaxID=2793270 RepID=A0A931H598_9BURK|nr:copper chaperone PCu(A)C [Caenimonas aquaedulcis]
MASDGALAHVSLQDSQAQAAQPYRAVFHVGHGCDGSPTKRIAVQVPAAFRGARPQPRPGWTLESKGGTVSWTAAADAAAGDKERAQFVLEGMAPPKAGAVWFKVLQTCEKGSMDWSQVPPEGTSAASLKTPAVLLTVLGKREFAALRAQPLVEGAWVRSSVPGQQSTGAFMRLKAREAVQLVGVESPAAGTADVHEMKMDGDVMRMRPLAALELKAGQTLELAPGGYHVMLQELRQPLAAGGTVPMTLTFRNAQGVQSKLELKVPVAAQAPGVAGTAPMEGHKH